ncbi:MAG: SGNH/GDSL hydrolase family protein [Halioglobus sp.]|nr:SGNH/GDSL hydrolase family protein [Halioglobus sp.]
MKELNTLPRKRRFVTTIMIVIFWVVAFVSAAEMILRWNCSYCTWTEANSGSYSSPYAINEDSWYLLRPANLVDSYRQPEFAYGLRTNSLGLRDIEHPLEKSVDEIRLLAIGDSFTEGQGAPFDDTWLSVLGRNLNRTGGEVRYTVISGGVAGSDPFYEYRLLMDTLLAYQPDIVMLALNASDINDTILRGGNERFLPGNRVRGISDAPSGVQVWLYEHSHFSRFILFETVDFTHLLITKSERARRAVDARKKVESLIVELDAQLKERGIKFVLVVMPTSKEAKRNQYDDVTDLQALLDTVNARGVFTIDTKPYLVKKMQENGFTRDDLYWPKDYHFTPLGYRLAGKAVQQGLCRSEALLEEGCDSKPPPSDRHDDSAKLSM